jgi:MFS family permease
MMESVDDKKAEAIPNSESASESLSPPSSSASLSPWTGYLQILAGHLMIFDTFGYIGSWGLFQSYYISTLGCSQSDVSWIGSLQIFLIYFVGTFSGRVLDAGYLRTTLAVGCSLQIIGIFTTASATAYWQILLSQGICVGLGDGLIFCPMISLISTYYEKDRALAVSFAAAGAATGGMVFPSIARQLIPSLGEPWAVRVMGFVFVFNSVIALIVVRPKVAPRKSGAFIEWEAFKELPYLLYAVGIFLSLWGLYFAYFYASFSSSIEFFVFLTCNTNVDLHFWLQDSSCPIRSVILSHHSHQWHRLAWSHLPSISCHARSRQRIIRPHAHHV